MKKTNEIYCVAFRNLSTSAMGYEYATAKRLAEIIEDDNLQVFTYNRIN